MKVLQNIILIIFAALAGCAKIGTPTGGPKDVDPPQLVRTDPKMYSTHFDKKKIEITFDEFIQLKDASQNLVISPPMAKKPVVVQLAKSFTIEFKDSLRSNTTYSLNFGNSIVDNNEGNPYENFRYVFSTGDYIDSLCTQGNILNAFDLKSDKEPFLIILHDDLGDSAIYKSVPTYIGRSNLQGNYRVENMHEGRFHLFAIKDANSNFKYDPYTEPVAFIDSVFDLRYSQVPVDTDSINIIKPDTLIDKKGKKKIFSHKESKCIAFPTLYYFKEQDTKQLIKTAHRKLRRKFDVSFNLPLDERFSYKLLSPDTDANFLMERNVNNDSLTFWMLDSALYNSDSIKMAFSYFSPYSAKMHNDTIRFNFFSEEVKKKEKEKDNEKIVIEKDVLRTLPSPGSTLEFTDDITIQSSFPIKNFDTSFMNLIEKIDTIFYERAFSLTRDSLDPRLLHLKYPWKSETPYRLELFPGCITDYYDLPTDTFTASFITQKEEYYGTLILRVKNVHSPVIIQLMEKTVLQERFISSDTTLRFTLLKPMTYSFKAIFDDNKNRKWDTGNLKEKKQPEKVLFSTESVTVRSNWDVESSWNLSSKGDVKSATVKNPPSKVTKKE